MEEFPFSDRERPIEEYAGYIGHTWDGQFYPGPGLGDLNSFGWQSYFELIDEGDRKLRVGLASGLTDQPTERPHGRADRRRDQQCP
jgi:hypothetical protein